MKRLFFLLLLSLAVTCQAEEPAKPEIDKQCALNDEQQLNLLNQTVDVFDANDQLGWRVLANKGCVAEAIALIKKYREKNGSVYRTAFHEAQLRLSMEDRGNARPLLFASLRSDLLSDNPFKWNDYVLGYLAYVDHDKDALTFYFGKLEKNSFDIRNKMNAKILIRLLENFDKPYYEIFQR